MGLATRSGYTRWVRPYGGEEMGTLGRAHVQMTRRERLGGAL